MKRIASLIGMFVVLLIGTVAQAQDFHRNAYGMYVAPSMYGYAKGTEFQLATSGDGLDFGFYFARAFTPGFSARLEAKLAQRKLDDFSSLVPNALQVYFRISETILELPLVLQADRRIPVGEHELRISVGAGAAYKYVLDQKLVNPSGESLFTEAESYQKLGLLLDGGTTFAVDHKTDVFLRFRYDIDVSTFGEPSGADAIRRFWAAGFYAGFEYGF